MSFQELFLPFSKIGKVSSNLWDFKSQTCTEPSEVPTKILMGVGAAFLSRKARAVTFWSMLRNNSGCTKAIFHAWTTLDWRYLGLHNGLLGWELHFCYWNMSRILVFVSQVNHKGTVPYLKKAQGATALCLKILYITLLYELRQGSLPVFFWPTSSWTTFDQLPVHFRSTSGPLGHHRS